MKALTIRQPWASLIACGAKDIENREWATRYVGVIAIHSSSKMHRDDMRDACDMMRGFIPKFSQLRFEQDSFPCGVILGTVEIAGCVRESDSHWFVGEYGFVLRNAIKFANPIPCRGALGLWEVPETLVVEARVEYRDAIANRA